MVFLEDLKINDSKVFVFGIDSEYSNYLISLFIKNGIRISLWDINASLIINSKDREEFKSKYITFLNPKEVNLTEYKYIIITEYIENKSDYYSLFNKNEIKNKICTDSDIIQRIYPETKFTGILGNSGQSVIKNVLEHISTETKLNLVEENDQVLESFPIVMSFRKLEYIKNVNFSTIIMYEYDEDYFSSERNLELFNGIILNNEEIRIVLNVDNPNLKELYDSLQDNNDFLGGLLPISMSKILNNGISYVNSTIYDYYNDNSNYDIMENEFIDNDFTKLAVLIAYVYNSRNNTNLTNENIIECFTSYSGERNFFEHVKNIENVCVINNIFADSDYLLQLPFKSYKNVYTIVFINDIYFNEKFFESRSKVVFYIDKNRLLNSKHKNVFYDEKEAFYKLYSLCILEKKEDKVTILLTASCRNKSSTLFKNEINNIKSLLEKMG